MVEALIITGAVYEIYNIIKVPTSRLRCSKILKSKLGGKIRRNKILPQRASMETLEMRAILKMCP